MDLPDCGQGWLKEAEQESKHWVDSQLDFKEYLTRRGIQEGSIQQVRGSVALLLGGPIRRGFAQYYLMIAWTHDPAGFNAFPLANLLTFIILIYSNSFLHRWKASQCPVLELNIEVVSFFHSGSPFRDAGGGDGTDVRSLDSPHRHTPINRRGIAAFFGSTFLECGRGAPSLDRAGDRRRQRCSAKFSRA
jgi:hypothetical protein